MAGGNSTICSMKTRAYEIMDEDLNLVNFTTDDIDWKSLESLPEYMKECAQRLSALFPTFVHRFQDGWQRCTGSSIPTVVTTGTMTGMA